MSRIIKLQSFFEKIKLKISTVKESIKNKQRIISMTNNIFIKVAEKLFKNKFLRQIRKKITSFKKIFFFNQRIAYIKQIKYLCYLRTMNISKNMKKIRKNHDKVSVTILMK